MYSKGALSKIFLLFILGLTPGFEQKEKLPNVLFILVDDLGYHDLGFTGSEIYQTPNIDQLASQSLSFGKAYSSYPRCVPSRYGMITGTYPVNEDNGYLAGIPEEKNFIRRMAAAGYHTSYVGKWHLGTDENAPTAIGFHESWAAGHSGGAGSRFYPFNILDKNGKNKDGDGARIIEDVEAEGKEGDYLSDLLTEKTMDVIRRNGKKQPFFAMLSFYSVHTPLEAKPEDKERNQLQIGAFDYGDTPEYVAEGAGYRKMRQDNADYAGMVENVDWNVGRLLSLLRELKMDKNTLIILSSDHGGLSNRGPGNRELATTNYPLRAGKGHLYEGGIRVPLLLHWKDKIVPGTDSTSIILGMDIFPTVLELTTGKQLPGIDGKSYKAVMAGQDSWDKRTVFWHKAKARPNSTGDTNSSVIRAGNLKLLHFYEEDRIELYDLSIDKSEEHNLAEDRADQAAVLLEELHIWKKSYLIPEKVNVKQMAKKNASKKN